MDTLHPASAVPMIMVSTSITSTNSLSLLGKPEHSVESASTFIDFTIPVLFLSFTWLFRAVHTFRESGLVNLQCHHCHFKKEGKTRKICLSSCIILSLALSLSLARAFSRSLLFICSEQCEMQPLIPYQTLQTNDQNQPITVSIQF